MRRNASNVNTKAPVQFWLLVAASSVALAGAVLSFSTRTVQADALLSRPATTMPVSPASSPTPVFANPTQPGRKKPADLLQGVASWYGNVFNGRRTASGELFDMYAMTACHPTLPFGTTVRVVNTKNHKSVVVRITDRGLLYDGRVLDLSFAAAEKLGMLDSGLAKVNIQILSMGHPKQNQ